MSTHVDFLAIRRFDSLQQLRTVSVLLVLASHMQDRLWEPLRGALGVQVFFVVSGFLITTLLLREESRTGAVSLRGFYVRRVFRILPVYYLALVAYAVPLLALDTTGERAAFVRSLPYYVTYQNELAPGGPFEHTWSLAVEEKFYLLWPLLMLLALGRTRAAWRAPACTLLLVLSVVSSAWGWSYLSLYTAILAGVLVALVLHGRVGYDATAWLRAPAVSAGLVVAAVASQAFLAAEAQPGSPSSRSSSRWRCPGS